MRTKQQKIPESFNFNLIQDSGIGVGGGGRKEVRISNVSFSSYPFNSILIISRSLGLVIMHAYGKGLIYFHEDY